MQHHPRPVAHRGALLAILPVLPILLGLAACGDDTAATGGGGAGGGPAGAGGSDTVATTTSSTTSSITSTSASSGGGGATACDDVTCPAGRVCVEDGACIVDLDPGEPAVDAVLDFDAIWTFYDESYGAFPAKEVDWGAVRDTFRPRVEAATTDFAAAWEIARSVAALGDGHTAAYPDALCASDPGFSFALSNVGACVVETGGEMVVYERVEGSGFEPGDVLVSLEGRTVEQALKDLERQPRCFLSASTPAQDRANRVASLLLRPTDEATITVRRGGEEVALQLAPAPLGDLSCDGRIGLPDEQELGPEVSTAVTEGDVLLIRLARFGTYDPEFVDGPVLDALREAFERADDHAGVILDLRGNLGGYVSLYMALASWLFPEPTPLFRCRTKDGPGHEDHGAPFEQIAEPDPSLQVEAPLAVLVDARSFSASDFTAMWIQATGRGVTVGAPSGGGFGNGTLGDPVAEGYTLGVNDILCEALEGQLLEGHPPAVDIPVEQDPADARDGIDTIIAAAEAWVLGR